MKTLSVTLLLVLSYYCSISQQDSKKWQVSTQINFSSVPALHFSGTDTISQFALSVAPSLDIRSNGGFGVNYSPYFILGGTQKGIFMHLLTVGLEQYDKKNYVLVADYNHFFLTGNKDIPTTPITNEIYVEGAYKKLWLSPEILAGVGFGTNTETSPSTTAYDVELAAGATHYFAWTGKNDFSYNVTPAILLNAGTAEYYSFLKLTKYISNNNNYQKIVKNPHAANKGRGNSGRPNSNPSSTASTTTSSTSHQTISLNNIELDLESTVGHGALSVRPSASLYIPFQSTSLSGYWQLNCSYYF